jgi:DNA-binding XRE family transcriptional regulator
MWPLVREHLDDVFDDCVEQYKGDWAKELLSGARLSEMARRPPLFSAVPCPRPAADRDTALAVVIVESGFEGAKTDCMPEIDWQLLNLERWDSNLRFALRSLLDPMGTPDPNAYALCGALESVRELFRLFRHFRPRLTKALMQFDALMDSRTRPQGVAYCELCWRESIRTKKLQEIDAMERREVGALLRYDTFTKDEQELRWAQAMLLKANQHLPAAVALISRADAAQLARIYKKCRVARMTAGKLSERHCSLHKPGSSKYHADLRYKDAFQRQLSVLMGLTMSDYAIDFQPPAAADMQEVRKTAYDQVHSRLHPIAPKRGVSLGLREKVWLMHGEGISQSEMARRLGVSRQAISKAKKSLEALINAQHVGRHLNPLTGEAQVSERIRNNIRDGLKRGLTVVAIAKEVGLGKGTVDGLVRLMDAR